MVYSDSALNEMKSCFDEMGFNYTVESLTEERVLVDVHLKDVTIQTWFDVKSGSYGFDMINGGSKTFADIISLRSFLCQYIRLIEVVIPNAKRVADSFSMQVHKNVVYDTFFGKLQSGFTIVFMVLGETEFGVHILEVDDTEYKAQLIRYNVDKSQYRVDFECHFIVLEDRVILKKDLNYFLSQLYNRYGGSDQLIITRSENESEFTFSFNDGYVLNAVVKNSGVDEQFYDVIKINSEYITLCIDEKMLGAPLFNMDAVHEFIVRYAESNGITISDEEFKKSENDGFFESEASDVAKSEVVIQDVEPEVNVKEDKSEVSKISEESVIIQESEMEVDEIVEELSLYKIIDGDDIVAVRFVLGSSLYDISIETARQMGIPCDAICDTIMREKRHGIKITVQERDMRTFAVNISDDREKCMGLVEKLFS